MSESMRESLSALLDDEANELEIERVLSRIGQDDELRQVWMRYQAVHASLAGHRLAHVGLDISDQVRAAIVEQTPRADARVNVGSLKQRVLRPLASFAVAASVAATVVIGGQQLVQIVDSGTVGPARTVAASASPVGMYNSLGATPVRASYGTQSVPVLQPATRTAYEKLARQRMQRYMQQHTEQAALNSPQGLMSFSRVTDIRE